MLRDLTRADWQGLLGIPDERIPRVLVLRGTRNLGRQYGRYAERFANALEVGSPNGLIEHVLIGDLGGAPVGYASVYGSAMASEVAHLFCVLGTELLVQTGCCGAWVDGVEPGDLFLPTRAACGEGAAQYYAPGQDVVPASFSLRDACDPAVLGDLRVVEGGIYTTAALFAEGAEDVEGWSHAGWDAVDMETATVFAVAQHFGTRAASLLYVFDNPRDDGDIVRTDAAKDERRTRGDDAMIQTTFRFVEAYLGTGLASAGP